MSKLKGMRNIAVPKIGGCSREDKGRLLWFKPTAQLHLHRIPRRLQFQLAPLAQHA